MPDHYFSQQPQSAHKPQQFSVRFKGHDLTFGTDAGVFSRDGLDKGTALLLDSLPELSGDVLDLGCGWGAVGVCAAKAFPRAHFTLADINSRAVELSRENAKRNGVQARVLESDGFMALADQRFSAILLNPPIRAGKQAVYGLFSQSALHLVPGGALYIVIRKQQGAPSGLKFLQTVFPRVQVLVKEGGYWIIQSDFQA